MRTRRKHSPAFSLPEMLIAVTMMAGILGGAVALYAASARQLATTRTYARSQALNFAAADHVRYRLLMGAFGTADVSEGGQRLEFQDPNLGGVTSAFHYDDGTLYYAEELTGNDENDFEAKVNGLDSLTFEELTFGAVIRVRIASTAVTGEGDVRPIRTLHDFYLRN